MFDKARLFLRSLTIQGIRPVMGENPGEATFAARFEVEHEDSKFDVNVRVTTALGWDDAQRLACEEVKQLGLWLAGEADKAKNGPHFAKLF